MGKRLGREEVQDRDALAHRVFLLPGRSLHLGEARADDHRDLGAAETKRGPAAVHRGVAAAEHDHAPADRRYVAERHAGEPVDADMNVARRLPPPGNVEVAPARRAAADENRIVAFADQRLEAVDPPLGYELAAGRERVADFLVDGFVGQAELRDLAAHHAAGARIGIEHHDLVADRGEITRDGERRRPRADAGDAPAVSRHGRARDQRGDVVLMIGGDALEPADRDRLLLEPSPAAGGFAWTVAGASQNPREHIRLPVDHIGAVVVARRDPADIFGDRSVRRARPLTVDDFMEVARIRDVRRRHAFLSFRPSPRCEPDRIHDDASLRTKPLKSGWGGDKRS